MLFLIFHNASSYADEFYREINARYTAAQPETTSLCYFNPLNAAVML